MLELIGKKKIVPLNQIAKLDAESEGSGMEESKAVEELYVANS